MVELAGEHILYQQMPSGKKFACMKGKKYDYILFNINLIWNYLPFETKPSKVDSYGSWVYVSYNTISITVVQSKT